MNKRPSPDDLQAFCAVAEYRSFRRAADSLSLSASTLSHTVRSLEDRLGVRLLNRTTRSVSPTEAGARLAQQLRPMLHALDTVLADASAAGADIGGTLRINTNRTGADLLLERVVAPFRARFPAVELELTTDERLVDIVASGFDAGVRLRESVPADMVAVPLGPPARFVAVASPNYISRYSTPRTPDDLRDHQCIRFRLQSGRLYRWEFARHGQEMAIDVAGALTLDSTQLALRAAAAGLGIAFGPEREALPLLRESAVELVLADWCPSWPGLHLFYPLHRHMTPALRGLVALLRSEFQS